MENTYSDYDGLVPTPEQVEAEDRYWTDREREEYASEVLEEKQYSSFFDVDFSF